MNASRNAVEVAREQQARVVRHRGRQVERREDRDAADPDGLARASTARSCRRRRPPRSTMTDPASSSCTMSAVMSRGAKTPPMSAVVMTTSHLGAFARRAARAWRAWSSSDSSLA